MKESLSGLKSKADDLTLPPLSQFKPVRRWPKVITLLLLLALAVAFSYYGYQYFSYQQKLNLAAKTAQEAYRYFTEGYFEDAIYALEKANKLNPNVAKNYFLIGKSYAFLGKLDEAKDNFYRAIELKPDYLEAHYQLALVLLEKKIFSEAMDELNKVLDLNPNFYVARLVLANILAQQGQLESALKHYNILADKPLRPQDQAEVHLALARLFIKQETRAQAQHLLQKALKLNPQSEEALKLNQQIKIVSHSSGYRLVAKKQTDAIDTQIVYPKDGSIVTKNKIAVLVKAQSGKPTIAEVQVSSDEGHSWFSGVLKDATKNLWEIKINLPKVNQANLSLVSRAVTSKGAVEKTTMPITIEVRNVGPPVFYYLDPPNPTGSENWYIFPPKIYLTTTQGSAAVFYRFNNEPYKAYAEAIKPLPGDNWLYFFSRDRHGSISTVNKVRVRIKLADIFLK